MFKIGDFSRLAQVSVRMLRHYDKLGLLEPSYTDRFTGYRYYTVDQLPRLNRIVALNDLGLTLAQIAGLLRQDDKLPPEQLRGMLALRQAELARELDEKRWQLARVEMRLQQIEQENDPDPYEIVIKGLDSVPVASLRERAPTVYDVGYFCTALYARLYAELGRLGIAWQEPELTLYHNEEYAETDIDMEVAAPVDAGVVTAAAGGTLRAGERIELRTLPACDLAAALVYEGPFEELMSPIQALLRFVGMHGHTLAGPLRELHLSGPAHGPHPHDRPVIELQVPIRRL